MKKILFVVLALSLAFGQVCFADLQLDEGQKKGTAGSSNVWFLARNARQTLLSADRVVIWDATSVDGITVNTTTTSGDSMVAGVTMDAIPGITSDATAANSDGFGNWGRVQVYGKHTNVSWDSGSVSGAIGSRVGADGTAGRATALIKSSADTGIVAASNDSFGVLLETLSTTTKDADIFIRRL